MEWVNIPNPIIHIITIANILLYWSISGYFIKKLSLSKSHRRFFVVLILSSLWILDVYLEWFVKNWAIYEIVVYFNYFLAASIAGAVTVFAIHFPSENKKLSLTKEILLLIPIALIAISSFTSFVVQVEGVRVYDVGNVAVGYILYFAVLLIYFCVLTPYFFIRKLIKSSGVQKIQLKYILTGYVISISILLVQSYITNVNGVIAVDADFVFTNISMVFSLFTAYAMLRYRFLDISLVFKKGFVYVFSLILMLGIYTYIILQLRSSIEDAWNSSVGWTAAVLILITVAGFIPVKKGVEYLVNKMFKGRKSIDLAVAELKKDISEQSDAAALAKLVTAQTRRFLDVGEAHVYLGKPGEELVSYGNGGDRITRDNDVVRYFQKYREPVVREEISHMMDEREGEFERDALQKVEKEMKKQKVAIAMPFVHEDGLYGLLTVGERETKEAFTVQDIQFLTKLREEIGFTLASALQYSYAMERIKQMQARGEL